jgi:hypothetical protein
MPSGVADGYVAVAGRRPIGGVSPGVTCDEGVGVVAGLDCGGRVGAGAGVGVVLAAHLTQFSCAEAKQAPSADAPPGVKAFHAPTFWQ